MSLDLNLDWEKLGLRVGLEIHQQLKTKTKLFCRCPIEAGEESKEDVFERRLRPARSELGEVDVAAYFEWKKGRTYVYHSPRNNTCLVEADEEPPHEISREAVLITLGIAKALGSTPVDEVHVMRKIVIDGSNTTGFQRTALVALGGSIMVGGKRIGIQTICVEEDAARKAGEEGLKTHYCLDRLGIPLIEISTAPDITSPQEAAEVALRIGQMLRLTGRVRRGIGTIRQDLNISIRGGTKIEVKGVQDLSLLPKVVAYEALRQKRLLEIKEELERRGVREEDVVFNPVDVSGVLRNTKSKIVRANLSKKRGKALAIKLPGMKGIIGMEVQPGRRFGTELADYARFWGDVRGLFHSDELPGYGISSEEVSAIYKALGADPEKDAFVLIVDEEEKALRALEAVVERVRQAFRGVPKETRAARPDGTTSFMRPQPGAARMYPETDIPPFKITREVLEEAEKYRPPSPEEKLREYTEELGLSRDLAEQMLRDESIGLFEELVKEFRGRVEPRIIASTLLVTLKGLRRKGVKTENITENHIREALRMLAEQKVSKEALEELLTLAAENPEEPLEELAKKKGLIALPEEEVVKIIERIIEENEKVVEEKGERAMGLIMGRAMSVLRGRAPGKLVADVVRRLLKEKTEKNK